MSQIVGPECVSCEVSRHPEIGFPDSHILSPRTQVSCTERSELPSDDFQGANQLFSGLGSSAILNTDNVSGLIVGPTNSETLEMNPRHTFN